METLQRTANRGSVSTGTYEIANSLKNEPDNGERFDTGDKFTNYSSVRKFTVSGWFKRTELSVQSIIWYNVNTGTSINLQFESGDFLSILLQDNVGNGVESYAKTSALFRDTSAWYHVVLAVDTTQGTAADRTKIYVNGVNQTLEQGNASYDTFPAQNYDVPLQTKHYLLGYDGGNNGFRGYVSEYYFLDGITASPTDFGETDSNSGIWIPKAYTGNFGNEGYYLDFEDSSALGKDVSSNNQGNFSHYGGSAADQATDTPTNNFCIINPLFTYPSSQVISEGGTKVARSSGSGLNKTFLGTIPVNGGKWYAEFEPIESNSNYVPGVVDTTDASTVELDGNHIGNSTGIPKSIGYYSATGGVLAGSNAANGAWGDTFTADDIIGVALDMDNRKVYFSKNGTFQNSSDPTNGTNAITLTNTTDPYLFGFTYDTSGNMYCNFGGYTVSSLSSSASDENGYGSFEYAPPSGYLALCTKNLATTGG